MKESGRRRFERQFHSEGGAYRGWHGGIAQRSTAAARSGSITVSSGPCARLSTAGSISSRISRSIIADWIGDRLEALAGLFVVGCRIRAMSGQTSPAGSPASSARARGRCSLRMAGDGRLRAVAASRGAIAIGSGSALVNAESHALPGWRNPETEAMRLALSRWLSALVRPSAIV